MISDNKYLKKKNSNALSPNTKELQIVHLTLFDAEFFNEEHRGHWLGTKH